jgi:hypothetical protein
MLAWKSEDEERQLDRKHTEGPSDELTELDAEDEDVVEWVVLGVEMITLADLGVRGMSCALTAVVPVEEGMINFSGMK